MLYILVDNCGEIYKLCIRLVIFIVVIVIIFFRYFVDRCFRDKNFLGYLEELFV